MKQSHKDINGKQIKLRDVVVIHKAKEYFSGDRTKKYYGCIGVVIGFGCVWLETSFEGDDGAFGGMVLLYFGCEEVEIIGKL